MRIAIRHLKAQILSHICEKNILKGREMELGVFGLKGFEQAGVRANLMRIPQVSVKISEAQKSIDMLKIKDIDLVSIINSDALFHSLNKDFKNFIISLFAIGLYEKHQRSGQSPNQFIINENLELVIDYIKAELLEEKTSLRFMENHLRGILRKGFYNVTGIRDSITPVSYGLCTAHARWMHRSSEIDQAPTMTYGLFFQFLAQSVLDFKATKIVYFGQEGEELHSLRKVVLDRWPTVNVISSVQSDTSLNTIMGLNAAVG